MKDDLLIHQPDRVQQKVAQNIHTGYHGHAIKITVHDVWRNNCLLLQKSCDLKKIYWDSIVGQDDLFAQTAECLSKLMACDPNLAQDRCSCKFFITADGGALVSNHEFQIHEKQLCNCINNKAKN